MSGEEGVHILWESSADPTTGAPMVVMTWDHKQNVYPIDRALATARDLYAAAAAAESDAALVETLRDHLGLDEGTTLGFLKDVRRRRTALQEVPAAKPILRIGAAYGHKYRRPFVVLHSGSLDAQCTPDDARMEAEAIYTVATAAVIDARTRHVLGERGLDVVAVEEILAQVCELGRENGILP